MISDQTLRRWLPAQTVALAGDAIRGLLWASVIVVWAIYPQIYLRMWRLTAGEPGGSDFTIFYYTARFVADGFPMYGASPARYGVHWSGGHLGNLNPPHFQLLLQPLSQLTYAQAFVVWGSVNAAALLLCLIIIWRALEIRITVTRVAAWGALVMASTPFTSVAVTSEWSFVLMVPFTLAWVAARGGRWRQAGAWLGVCIALKLFFLLFVPWLMWRKRWRALAAALAVGGLWTAVGVLAFGSDTYVLWARSLAGVGWWWLPMNASWQGVVSRVFEGGATVQALVSLPALVRPLSLVGSLMVAITSVWAAVRLEQRPEGHVDAAVLALLAGAILASPLGWVYYLPLALGPLAGVLRTGWWRPVPPRWAAAAVLTACALYVPLEQAAAGQPSTTATLVLACSYFWGLMPSWLVLVTMARRTSA